MERRRSRLAFAVLSLFFLGTTILWLRLDRKPPSWDDAFYLTNSLAMFDALTDGGLPSYSRQFLTAMGPKPPLIAVLPTPLYLLFGRRERVAYVVNLFSLLVMFSAIYCLGKQYSSRRAGLLAVFVAGTMPVVYGLSRWYLVECGLMAIVCVAMLLLARWDDFPSAWKGMLLGTTCGLGLLMKMSFPLYVLAPILYFVVSRFRTMQVRKTLWAIAAPAGLLILPWYLVNFRRAMKVALEAGSVKVVQLYGTGDVLSLADISNYLLKVINAGPTFYFVVLLALTVTSATRIAPAGKRGLQLCLLWCSPILFLMFSHYREVRYAAPLYPALALALAILIDATLRRHGRAAKVVACVLLALPMLGMLEMSFGMFGDVGSKLSRFTLVATQLPYARPYEPANWPHGEILDDIYRHAKFSGGEKKSVLIGTDSLRFNADIFKFRAAERKLPFEINTTAYETDPNAVIAMVDSAGYFIYWEGGEPAAPFFNTLGAEALKEVRMSGRFVELPVARALPAGGVLHVFANLSPNRFVQSGAFLEAGMNLLRDCNVTFAEKLQLTGVSLRRIADGLEVKCRWRSIRPVDREYWCFAHIIDRRNNVIGYLDHKILNGEPPMTDWRAGDVAIERLVLPRTALENGEPYRLRLGLFDRLSGERLLIGSSGFPLTNGQTAALVTESGGNVGFSK